MRRRFSPERGADETDWAMRDKRNRKLGVDGTFLFCDMRKNDSLLPIEGDLSKMVKSIAPVDSSAGYDIRSFEVDGFEMFIEVKTASGPKIAAFFISANEMRASIRNPDGFGIYRVSGVDRDPKRAAFYVLRATSRKS